MTNASKTNSFAVLSIFVIAGMLSLGAFATIAHAQEDLGFGYTGDSNLGYGYTDDSNLGYGYTGDSNLGYGYTDDSNLGYGYTGTDVYGTDVYGTDVYGTDVYGTDVIEQYGVAYTQQSYPSYGHGSYSYSYPTPTPISPPRPVSYPVPIYQPVQQQQQQQQQQGGQPISIVNNNVNTNTNVNNPTPIAQIVPIYQATPQVQVQYVYPQQTPIYPIYPTYQNISCTLTAGPGTLTWTSYGATSATMSDGIGYVAPNGSMAVRPEVARTYVLTVYGQNGQVATCNAFVNSVSPYVSLSQIPYTGFDFGPVGNTIYWALLAGFALASAYLVVYFRGGAFALATEMVRGSRVNVSKRDEVIATPVAAIQDEPVVSSIQLPTEERHSVTSDSMIISHGHGSIPRIVITRG